MDLQEKINRSANWYLMNGYSVIPIAKDKRPAVKWGEYIDKPMEGWDYPGCGIAFLTGEHNGVVVVDCDSLDSYVSWLKKMPRTPMMIRTARGMHFYYKHPGTYVKSDSHVKSEDGSFEYDIKGDKSYVLAPPSMRDGHQYQICINSLNPSGTWIHDLPPFEPQWRPERVRDDSHESDEKIKNAVAYISKIQAVAGNGGDKDTYRVCCRLAESDLSDLEKYQALLDWNATNANPPWDQYSLRRKLELAIEECS